MFSCMKLNISKEKEELSKQILKWCLEQENILNIISFFYNSSVIFLETILLFINNKKQVLYITDEQPECVEILSYVDKLTILNEHKNSVTQDKGYKWGNLTICTHEQALQLQGNFDLIIYNDMRSFPRYSNRQIKEVIMQNMKSTSKIISYAIEAVFEEERSITFPIRENKKPIVEPRIVLTRINIRENIPLVIYEYLKWSMLSDRKVIIYVPDEERARCVFDYLNGFKEFLSHNIFLYISKKSKVDIAFQFIRKQKGIIITNDFEETSLTLKGLDVMVYFADDLTFDYKKLVYFCSKVGRDDGNRRGEVIFLANEETDHMEEAKRITRNFNKKAWEEGLLNV